MAQAMLYDFYRMDGRDIKEFARDIKQGVKTESEIISLYAEYWRRKTGETLTVKNNGCDNSGRLLMSGRVSLKADYLVKGKPVEVKFNNSMLSTFRFKAAQLEGYLKQGAAVLWVNGWQTEAPIFTVLKAKHLQAIKENSKPLPFIHWGGKMCYELSAADYTWALLKEGGESHGDLNSLPGSIE
ncbi:hypothetical protein [Heliophilum fasciatum]|uniref:Uncharacterized protein n=1 Tax=Heliophilum fasciatum TaxID=35700 RepID=A0A4R2RAX0_9FIRM|nr:hypothetical protein [Heliophilum fasciatum]MCW2279291.1 hypothetical protein [Heliophilum fasciatum]TCP60452.1 hypothetical protein EDD73_13712 [Heliophilum fasciatum]